MQKPYRLAVLRLTYKAFPIVVAVIYAAAVLYSAIVCGARDTILLLALPFAAFLTVTLLRFLFNFERPYERLKIIPLIAKQKSGKSFPSRHCASAFVIASACFKVNAVVGCLLLAVSLCIAVSRVLAGVHFVRDVAAGAAIGMLFGFGIFLF